MGIKQYIGQQLRSLMFNNQNVDQIFGLTTGSSSGMSITEYTALSNPTLLSGIRLISETVASLPLKVMVEDENGYKHPAMDHPLFYKLLNSPSERFTTFTFIQTLIVHLYLYGNAYIQINWKKGSVGSLELLFPPGVTEFSSGPDFWYMAMIREGPMSETKYIKLFPYEVIKINWMIIQNFFKGVGLLELSKDPIGLALALDGFAASYFRNGAAINGFFTFEKELTPDQKSRMKEQLEQNRIGVSNAFRQLFMPQGVDYKKLSNNPLESQSVEQREFQVEETARILRIPPHMLGARVKETKGTETDSIDFLKWCIHPLCTRVQQALNQKLFLGTEANVFTVEFDLKELLKTEALTQANALAIERQNGIINGNEWRAQIGLPPKDDPTLNDYIVLSNMGGIDGQLTAEDIQSQMGELGEENNTEDDNIQ